MNEKILQLITEYGLEATVIAIAINTLTGMIKLPIKQCAKRLSDSTKLTRYLVFLPVFIGFGLTALYTWITSGEVEIGHSFITMWVSSSSLSMTFYAFWEKLFPTKERILKECEIEANQKLLEQIKEMADKNFEEKTENAVIGEMAVTDKKIILKRTSSINRGTKE